MCDRAYPKKLAYQYLEDLKNEFERVYGNQIETAARPYAFIKFGKVSLIGSSVCSFLTCVCNLITAFSCIRHIHTEDKEIVPRYENTKECCKVE